MQTNNWYYTVNGEQHGPLAIDQIKAKIASNELSPEALFWTEGMKEWTKSSAISALAPTSFTTTSPPPQSTQNQLRDTPAHTPSPNPYATPNAPVPTAAYQSDASIPINPIPLDVGFCVKQGWKIAIKNLGIIIGLGLIYWIISAMVSGVLGGIAMAIDSPSTTNTANDFTSPSSFLTNQAPAGIASIIAQIISSILDIFLSLGATSFGLKLLRGENPGIAELFSQGDKTWKAFGAYILYILVVIFGTILLIIPGIYFALKFMFYQTAMVDKDLGVIESFKYSSELTRDNKMNLLGLAILSFFIIIAGILVIFVGLIWAWPCVWLAQFIAYKYLHGGEENVQAREV